MTEKTYSREEYVYLAKLYERAEKFNDMVKWISKYVELDPNLSTDERNFLSAGYKNLIGAKRNSWRLLRQIQRKEEKKNSTMNMNYITEVRNKVEDEMRGVCNELNLILDKFLIPGSKDAENKVFYMKLKGDYYRYRAEFSSGKEFEEAAQQGENVYKAAYEIAKDIPISSSTRLGLALNFSVFYFEILNNKEQACKIAKSAFDDAIKILDELERNNQTKDSILIIQLLKENLNLWNNEQAEEDS